MGALSWSLAITSSSSSPAQEYARLGMGRTLLAVKQGAGEKQRALTLLRCVIAAAQAYIPGNRSAASERAAEKLLRPVSRRALRILRRIIHARFLPLSD